MGLRRWLRVVLVGRERGVRAGFRRRLRRLTPWGRPDGATWSEPGSGASTLYAPPAPPEIPNGWTQVLDLDEVPVGEVVEVVVGDRSLAVANVDGTLHAVDNACPHAGGPLGDGDLDGCTLTCPWHGWSFDVRDGSCFVSDEVQVETVPVRIVGDAVCVQFSAGAHGS